MTEPGSTNPSPAPTTHTSDQPPHRYTAALAQSIETQWQTLWDQHHTFRTPNPGEPGFDTSRPKQFILDMFPYPSGVGLHVGHPLGYIATDIYARYLRMNGCNVLHTMGFDSFGLPAEQYAVQTGTHPRITTERNIDTMRTQLRRLGLAHDPARSVSTTDTDFYRWTQWIFLQIYNAWYDAKADKARPIADLEAGLTDGSIATVSNVPWSKLTPDQRRAEIDARRLAFSAEVPVNWCPMLGTVLANEEVTSEGRSERGNFPVYKRPLRQWMMRITAYADRLLSDLNPLDWPEPIKLMQRNWIGRSEGASAEFHIQPAGGVNAQDAVVSVFTTRPDTLFGATYVVLAPEHPLVDGLIGEAWNTGTPAPWKGAFPGAPTGGYATPREAVTAYRAFASARTDEQRTENKEKTGVFTGAYAINPVTGAPVPVFIADYVLTGYGTGAIMAVPGHDERDFEFARALSLPIRDVVYPRAVHAMKYFVEHAYPNADAPAEWRDNLADFLGLVTSATDKHEPLDVTLAVTLNRRQADEAVPSGVPISKDAPGMVGTSRGTVRAAWLENIEATRVTGFADLRARFERAGYWEAAGEAYAGPGWAVNSASGAISINGLPTDEAKHAVTRWLAANKLGRATVTFKLRDWLFSRQRYWGEPFPVVYDEQGRTHALPESMLPVLLPELTNFQPESSSDPDAPPRPPLARAKEWTKVTLDLGDGPKVYTRETNTMPNWAGSCWYYLRYLDPSDQQALVAPGVEQYWMAGPQAQASTQASGKPRIGGVDLYVGGVEHAVLHLLYARFWHKVLFDLGHVSTPEPFQRLFNQGYIQAFAFTDSRGMYVEASKVEQRGDAFFFTHPDGRQEEVRREYGKMGKSLKNAVSPDEVFAEFGCDTLRVYEMAMGPLEASKPWNTRDIAGSYRFLQRIWRNFIDENTGRPRVTDEPADRDTQRILHKTIRAVRDDMARLSFNTAVSKLIELNNHLSSLPGVPREVAKAVILMVAPIAPHIAEELFHRVVREAAQPGAARQSILHEPYPISDEALAADDAIEIPVSIMGKVRHRIMVTPGADAKTLEAAALADAKVIELIGGKPVKKIIVVPGKMVNLVLG